MSVTYFNGDEEPNLKLRRVVNFRDTYLRNREYGFRPKYGDQYRLHKEIYTAMYPIAKWDYDISNSSVPNPASIYNLEFSPDGKILAAACENKSFMLFDPVTQKFITCRKNAHNDCVNYTKFLDSYMLATCSNDKTIAIWDVRNLKDSIRELKSHTNWVKSIEYSSKDNLLVSSGFDGLIFKWDINKCSEEGIVIGNFVCHINGLMRIKLFPDSSKLFICTTSGFILFINDLDLETLKTDLNGFNPNTYRLMQLNKTTIPNAAAYTHMFTRKRNRLEFIVDFPTDDAEIISSIQVHPYGWNVLSRSVTTDEQSEWTCVHDVQDIVLSNNLKEVDDIESSFDESAKLEKALTENPMDARLHQHSRTKTIRFSVLGPVPRRLRRGDLWEASINDGGNRIRYLSEADERSTNSGIRIIRSATGLQEMQEIELLDADNQPTFISDMRMPNDFIILNSRNTVTRSNRLAYLEYMARTVMLTTNRGDQHNNNENLKDHKIYINKKRLTHYIEEANVSREFIKELCYSNDGRLICSPFSHGVRLLSFSPDCEELSTLAPRIPSVKLHEIGSNISHSNIVLCTKFSPIHPLLVSGCLDGRLVWYQPRI